MSSCRLATVAAAAVVVLLAGSEERPDTRDGPRVIRGQPLATPDTIRGPMWIEMRNVDLHIDETHVLGIRVLRGEVVRTKVGVPAALDDSKSFTVRVTQGTVTLSGDALAALLNEFVFAYHGAPLKRLRARTSGSQVVLSGVMHKGVDLPFEITSSLALEPDGRVRLHPTKTRILGIDGAKLMHALGLHLDKLLDLRGAHGIAVIRNDLLLEPTQILPPPAIDGRLASIGVEGGVIVQTFARLADDSVFDRYARPDTTASNFIYFRGGELRFGKLLMSDTDLEIIDADDRDAFDLDLDQYARQLVGGTSRTLPNQGLRVIMPDYRRVHTPAARATNRGAGEHPDDSARRAASRPRSVPEQWLPAPAARVRAVRGGAVARGSRNLRGAADLAPVNQLAAAHACALAALGDADAARRHLVVPEESARKGEGAAVEVACAYHSLGNDDLAFEWLARGSEARELGMSWLHLDPRLRRLHGQPRFKALIERVGLAPRV